MTGLLASGRLGTGAMGATPGSYAAPFRSRIRSGCVDSKDGSLYLFHWSDPMHADPGTNSTPLTDAEIAELRRMHEAATPEPWTDAGNKIGCEHGGLAEVEFDEDADLALAVAARNALPRLLAALERASELLVRYRTVCNCNSPRNANFGTACKLCRDADAYLNRAAGAQTKKD